jgi:hypothetical protein
MVLHIWTCAYILNLRESTIYKIKNHTLKLKYKTTKHKFLFFPIFLTTLRNKLLFIGTVISYYPSSCHHGCHNHYLTIRSFFFIFIFDFHFTCFQFEISFPKCVLISAVNKLEIQSNFLLWAPYFRFAIMFLFSFGYF